MQSTLSGRSSRNHLYSCVFCLCQTILYFPSSFFTSSHHWNVQIKILPFHHYHHTKYISLTEVMIRDWTLIALYSINIIWCFKTYKPRILLPKKKGIQLSTGSKFAYRGWGHWRQRENSIFRLKLSGSFHATDKIDNGLIENHESRGRLRKK